MRQIQQLALEKIDFPNEACAQANGADLWRCFFVDELINYVDHPVYFLQSLYDGFGIAEVLGLKCAEEFASLSECTKEHREAIENYHQNLTSTLEEITQEDIHSGFGISCIAHSFFGFRWNNDIYEVPQNSGHRAINVVSNWAEGKSSDLYIDTVNWPDNKPCANKAMTYKQVNLKTQ